MTGQWDIFSWLLNGSSDCKRLGYDSRMGQWQVSITSTPPSSTLTLCFSWSKAFAAFFCLFPSFSQRGWEEGEAGDHPGAVPSWNAPIMGREVAKTHGGGFRQRSGWKLCQGRMPGVTRRYEALLYGVPPCPSREPSPGPISYFPLWNQTLQSRELKSMVRNNLTVCHRSTLLPTRAKEASSRVYLQYVCVSDSLSICFCICSERLLACACVHSHVLEGTTLFVVGPNIT